MEDETNLEPEAPEVESAPAAAEQEVELDDSGNPVERAEVEADPELADVDYDGKQYKLQPSA